MVSSYASANLILTFPGEKKKVKQMVFSTEKRPIENKD